MYWFLATAILQSVNCLFKNNWAEYGGGISIDNSGVSYVTNCTFVANMADSSGGSAIYGIPPGEYGDVVIVTNCILWGNVGEQISGDIDANVTYCDIEGGWPGVGNISKNPMFGPDGWHLLMCSPCIDAGTNTPVGGLPATDIDGQARIMNGRCVGEAIVDMGVDEYLPDCNSNALLYAHCQSPTCGATDGLYVGEAPDVNLTWCPGTFAADVNGQDVYFGTDYSGVYNATTSSPQYKGRQSATIYIATGLEAGVTYYWRIDEVNGTNIWRGSVWSFTTGLFIDDFERYSNANDMNANWTTGYTINYCYDSTYETTFSNVTPDGNLGFVVDSTGKHMNFYYNAQPFSEARYEYGSHGVDWTNSGIVGNEPNMLVLSYKGAIGNAVDPFYNVMYVALEDTAGNVGMYLNDPNAQQVAAWTQWYIPLNDPNFTTNAYPRAVNMAAVSDFYIGFGQRCLFSNPGGIAGDGNVMFDNIRLEPPVMPGYADFTGDCFVNFNDFAVMGAEWHSHSCGEEADLNHDCFVDLMDFVVLAEEWLK